MQIIIEDNRTIRLTQVFDLQSEVLEKHFRVKDPQAHRKKSMKFGHWDGYHRFYNSSEQVLRRGYLKDLIKLCVDNDFPFDIVDRRPKSKYPVPSCNSFDNKLIDAKINGNDIVAHEHQMRCWNSVCKATEHPLYEVGTHFHPTGGGKSLMMAGIVKLIRCPTVIITEQSIVLDQIVKSLKLFNVVHHDDIGEFYSGKMPDGNIACVGSIAALQTPKKPVFAKFDVKLTTLKKDFERMYNNKFDDLKKIMSINSINAWRRSCVIDDINKKYSKNKRKFANIIPNEKDWTDIDLAKNIDFLLSDNPGIVEKSIGIDNFNVWKETSSVSENYEYELKKSLVKWHTYEKNKYFEIAMKSYGTRMIKCRELQEMVSECELLLVDEMDNAASNNYNLLFDKWFNGRYIHGFSGTPYDPDKPIEEMKLRGCFGPVISKSSRRELEGIGQIQPVRYLMMQFGEFDKNDKTAFDIAEREIIIDNNKFHRLILRLIGNWKDEKHLIVIDTSNIEDLGKSLNNLIPNSLFVYGKVPNVKRFKMIKNFEDGVSNVLIVSKVGKRGMDLGGGAHNLFLIGGGKNKSNFDQIIGRAVRKNDKGFSRVIDFYYTGNYYLLNHSRKRLRYIVDMGYKSDVIYNNKNIDAEEFIKYRYNFNKFI